MGSHYMTSLNFGSYSFPTVTLLGNKAFILLLQDPWPLMTVTSFMDDPYSKSIILALCKIKKVFKYFRMGCKIIRKTLEKNYNNIANKAHRDD